jgi:hypothetical protein
MSHPGGSLPEKFQDYASLMGLYRLVRQPQVTHRAVLEPHRQRTLELMRHAPVVLLLSDTTEFDFSAHWALKGAGPVGNGKSNGGEPTRGFLCHNTLAITPERRVLGLASQIMHVRREVPGEETALQKRNHPQRESRLWVDGCEAIGAAPRGCLWVDITDRGGDTFEFLDFEHRNHRHYVMRSSKNRKLDGADHVGDDRIHQYLHEYARDLPVLGQRRIQVCANRGRTSRRARTATVSISAAAACIAVPHFARGNCLSKSLDVWVIAAREIDPPAGVEALEWIVLSNLPAETLRQASEKLNWYECRPVVEELHKGQKSGINIEGLRFEYADRMLPVIALLSVVAAMLLDLRQQAREPEAKQTPATNYVPLLWVEVLSGWRHKQIRTDMTLYEFYMALAKLGGHLGRKSDGYPGWRKLWIGWSELQIMLEGAMAIQRKRCV